MLKLLRSLEERSEGDPRKIADVIVRLANSDEVPVRLILGVDRRRVCTRRKLPAQARRRSGGISLCQQCSRMRNLIPEPLNH